MKTMTLIDVPKTHPSRQAKLDAFKKLHDIATHRSNMAREDCPWCACAMKPAREMWKNHQRTGEPTLFDLVAHLCRRLEESGILTTGVSERDAVQLICDNLGIPFTL